MKPRMLVALLFWGWAWAVNAAPSITTYPESQATKNTTNSTPKKSDNNEDSGTPIGIDASPKLAYDNETFVKPSLETSFQDVWIHGKNSTRPWKHKFAASLTINGEIQADDNEELIQDFMQQGGNINFGLSLGVSAFGGTHDGFQAYLKGEWSRIETKEYTAPDETIDLEEEVATVGIGLGLKWREQFYLGWEGGKSHVLGSEDEIGVFHDSVDQKWMQNVMVIMELQSNEEDKNFIQIYRSWGAEGVDASLGIAYTKTFKNVF